MTTNPQGTTPTIQFLEGVTGKWLGLSKFIFPHERWGFYFEQSKDIDEKPLAFFGKEIMNQVGLAVIIIFGAMRILSTEFSGAKPQARRILGLQQKK